MKRSKFTTRLLTVLGTVPMLVVVPMLGAGCGDDDGPDEVIEEIEDEAEDAKESIEDEIDDHS